jgi:hypothetical protein
VFPREFLQHSPFDSEIWHFTRFKTQQFSFSKAPFILRFNSSQAKEARQQCATELLVSRVSEATEVTIQLTLL